MPFSRTKTVEPPTKMQVYIDRLRFVLGVVAILAIAITFTINHNDTANLGKRVTSGESPCLRYGPKSKQCRAAFGAAIKSVTPYQLCILLERKPELTGVFPADCARIANEAKKKAAKPAPGSHGGSRGGPQANNPPGAGSAPTGSETNTEGSLGHSPGGPPTGGQQSPGHSPSHIPKPPSPAPSPSPTPHPGGSGGSEGSNPAPAPSFETPSHHPPFVEVETPGLPIQACVHVPGVASVNC